MGGEIKREEEEVGLVAGGGAGAVLTGAKTLQTIIKKTKGWQTYMKKKKKGIEIDPHSPTPIHPQNPSAPP
jgi:hypothetical protein